MIQISTDVFSIRANDFNRKLFDELIPLPNGTSYNSYLVIGSNKTALIDTVDLTKFDILLNVLKDIKKVDYIVSNHAEQDHSGSIPKLLELYPLAKIVTNEKCKEFLMDLLNLSDDSFILINDNDTLLLGNKTLRFIFTPWSHWPETMVTFLEEDNILFSCDLFGSHYATETLFFKNSKYEISAIKRYYAEIMMPFRFSIIKNLIKIRELNLKIIAPSHGPIYSDINYILNEYDFLTSNLTQNKVIIIYVSMHGSTKEIVQHLEHNLLKYKIQFKSYCLADYDLGELAIDLIDSHTLVIASPTVLIGPHPLIVNINYLINLLRPKTKLVGIICSYGWGGKTIDQIKNSLFSLPAKFISPVLIKGKLKNKVDLDAFTNSIVDEHKLTFN